MKMNEIKRLVSTNNLQELMQAETEITDGLSPKIEVNGEDEGEKLTHVLAAIEVIQFMKNEGMDLNSAIRKFSERVRSAIS